MTNRQEAAASAAKRKIAEDYRQALAIYGSPFPSDLEIQHAILEAKLLRLKQAVSVIGNVADRLTPSGSKKSTSCGCTGKSGSAGRYETKSLSNGSRSKPNYFAMEMQRRQDEAYEAFCSKFPDMCKG